MSYLAMVLLIISILSALVGFADDGADPGGSDVTAARALAMGSGVSFLIVAVLAATRARGAVDERDEV